MALNKEKNLPINYDSYSLNIIENFLIWNYNPNEDKLKDQMDIFHSIYPIDFIGFTNNDMDILSYIIYCIINIKLPPSSNNYYVHYIKNNNKNFIDINLDILDYIPQGPYKIIKNKNYWEII